MKAAVYVEKEKIEIQDIARPEIEPGDATDATAGFYQPADGGTDRTLLRCHAQSSNVAISSRGQRPGDRCRPDRIGGHRGKWLQGTP